MDRYRCLTTAMAGDDVTTLATALDDLDAGRLQSADQLPALDRQPA